MRKTRSRWTLRPTVGMKRQSWIGLATTGAVSFDWCHPSARTYTEVAVAAYAYQELPA